MPENRLFATILKKDLNDQEKSVTAYANKSDSIDRSGDLIDDEAWELDNFLKNPVVPAFHMYNRPPIGKALWIKVVPGQGLRFKVQFAKTAEGLEFYELFSGGFLNAFSVGFMPKEWIDREDFTPQDIAKYMRDGNLPSRVYKKVELFEVSAVVVPDHMNALVERSAQGLIKTKEVNDFIEQIKSSKEYIELTEPTEEKAKKIGFIDLETKYQELAYGIKGDIPADFNNEFEKELDHENSYIMENGTIFTPFKKKAEPTIDKDMPQKPCQQEGGQCMKDCEEYNTCEDEEKKSFESEEVKDEDTIEDKGISDDSEAGLLDIPDNGVGEVDGIVEEKEVNLDEIESKNEEIIGNNTEEKHTVVEVKFNFEETLEKAFEKHSEEIKSYINEIVEEKLKFLNENADKVNIEENSEVQEKQVDIIELKEPEKIDFEFKEKTVDVDFDPEEIKTMMKSAILTTVNDSKSMDKLVEERIRRMKGIVDFEDE